MLIEEFLRSNHDSILDCPRRIAPTRKGVQCSPCNVVVGTITLQSHLASERGPKLNFAHLNHFQGCLNTLLRRRMKLPGSASLVTHVVPEVHRVGVPLCLFFRAAELDID